MTSSTTNVHWVVEDFSVYANCRSHEDKILGLSHIKIQSKSLPMALLKAIPLLPREPTAKFEVFWHRPAVKGCHIPK